MSNPSLRVLLFRHHAGDPLSSIISAITRGGYVHAAFLIGGLTIIEAYYPTVRQRELQPEELVGVDVFSVDGLTLEQEAAIVAYAQAAVKAHERYSIPDLFRLLAPVRAVLGDGDDSPGFKTPTFCSEFVVRSLRDAVGIFVQNAPAVEVDPVRLGWSVRLLKDAPLVAPVKEAA